MPTEQPNPTPEYNIQFVLRDPKTIRRLRELAIEYGDAINDYRTQGGATVQALLEELLQEHPDQAKTLLYEHAKKRKKKK